MRQIIIGGDTPIEIEVDPKRVRQILSHGKSTGAIPL
jgi:hypothetical protein